MDFLAKNYVTLYPQNERITVCSTFQGTLSSMFKKGLLSGYSCFGQQYIGKTFWQKVWIEKWTEKISISELHCKEISQAISSDEGATTNRFLIIIITCDLTLSYFPIIVAISEILWSRWHAIMIVRMHLVGLLATFISFQSRKIY